MSLHAIVSDPTLLVSPLEGFLVRRLPRGRFGAPRSTDDETMIGGQSYTYTRHRAHEGVDLVAREGARVFAVTDGLVAVSATNTEDDRGPAWVVLDHHPSSLGHISVYYHLSVGIDVGTSVREGQLIGFVGTHRSGSHLHFELRHVTVPSGSLDSDRSSVPLNPGPSLERYSFSDEDAQETEECHITELWVMQHATVAIPYMRIKIDTSELNFFLPLEHPSADDLQMASVLKLTFEHRNVVRLRFVQSGWHEQRRVIRGVRLVAPRSPWWGWFDALTRTRASRAIGPRSHAENLPPEDN